MDLIFFDGMKWSEFTFCAVKRMKGSKLRIENENKRLNKSRLGGHLAVKLKTTFAPSSGRIFKY